jgi:uncharacterized protein
MADRIAVVTGASSGIGAELALELAGRGYTPWLVARREERLQAVAGSIEKASGRRARVIVLDLASGPARQSLVGMMRAEASQVALVINNAGFGAVGATLKYPWERYAGMIALNVEALTELSLEAARIMVEAGQGGIINVASTAAFQPVPWMNTYSATKAFVLHFSEALSWELKDKGVRVMALCPGYTRTEFQEVAGVRNDDPRLRFAMSARDCARAGLRDFERGRRVSVTGLRNRAQILGTRLFPRGVVNAIASQFLKDHA